MLVGTTVSERKKCLAELVAKHLNEFFNSDDSEVVKSRVNSAGLKDQVVVESKNLGLIHLTATGSVEPNDTLVTCDFEDGNQNFLADKSYVAYGWNSRDGRTFLMFVKSENVAGKQGLTKSEIKEISEKKLNKVYLA